MPGTHLWVPLKVGPGLFPPMASWPPCCLSSLLMWLSLSCRDFSSIWLVSWSLSWMSCSHLCGVAIFRTLRGLASCHLYTFLLDCFLSRSHSVWFLWMSFTTCSWFYTSQSSWIHQLGHPVPILSPPVLCSAHFHNFALSLPLANLAVSPHTLEIQLHHSLHSHTHTAIWGLGYSTVDYGLLSVPPNLYIYCAPTVCFKHTSFCDITLFLILLFLTGHQLEGGVSLLYEAGMQCHNTQLSTDTYRCLKLHS